MKVTKIQQQLKRADRYSIFLDEKYAFSLSELELLDLQLRVGQSLEKNELDKVNVEVLYSNAKNSTLRLLSYRARSTWEIEDYLKRKKYEKEVSDRVIRYLSSKDLINDEKFARAWVESRVSNRKASIRQIKNELKYKKVPDSIVNRVIEEESIDEVELIKQLIDKKRSHSKYKDEVKLMQFLARRGFSYDKILIALGRRAE